VRFLEFFKYRRVLGYGRFYFRTTTGFFVRMESWGSRLGVNFSTTTSIYEIFS